MEAPLIAIASLPYALSHLRLYDGMVKAMDASLQVTKAEVAEVFLQEPVAGDMVLAAHRGPFRAAFYQLIRFKHGEGYPGIVAAQRQTILSPDLRADPRFLRDRVKERGFRSCFCIPLQYGDTLVGSLNLASRDAHAGFHDHQALVAWAASVMAMAVRLHFHEAQRHLESSVEQYARQAATTADVENILGETLVQALTLSEATGSTGILYDKAGRLVHMVQERSIAGKVCVPESASNCPALTQSRIFFKQSTNNQQPDLCPTGLSREELRVCVPLIRDRLPLGILQLGYAKVPNPPTKDVALVASMALRASNLLGMGRLSGARDRRYFLVNGGWRSNEREISYQPGYPSSLTVEPPNESSEQFNSSIIGQIDSSRLGIRCLGTFQVCHEGELLPVHRFPRRKALTLLKVLSIKRGSAVPADTLAEYLWPEDNPKLVSRRLQVVVSSLRQIVDRRLDGLGWQFIRNEGNSYSLALSEDLNLDIVEYQQLLARAQRLRAAGREDDAIVLYRQADHLYRGDLLEDEPYAEWCSMERETLRETHIDILRQLALALSRQRDLEAAICYYRKALRLDPLREELHRQLASTLLQAGRRDEALRQYLQCCEILKQELGIDPAPETEAVHQSLMN